MRASGHCLVSIFIKLCPFLELLTWLTRMREGTLVPSATMCAVHHMWISIKEVGYAAEKWFFLHLSAELCKKIILVKDCHIFSVLQFNDGLFHKNGKCLFFAAFKTKRDRELLCAVMENINFEKTLFFKIRVRLQAPWCCYLSRLSFPLLFWHPLTSQPLKTQQPSLWTSVPSTYEIGKEFVVS